MEDSVPPHRAFLSVELPFMVPVSGEGASSDQSNARKVESLLPPSLLCRMLTTSASTSTGGTVEENQSSYAIMDPQKYSTEPQCAEWVGFEWSSDDDSERPSGDGEGQKRRKVEKDRDTSKVAGENNSYLVNRNELFPSITPRILLQSYCRNDVLLKVRRRRRVRQVMVWGKVIREEPLPEEPEVVGTEVLGVVSRDVEISRPADFSFSLFTKEEKMRAPDACHGDIFPPAHFIYDKAPFEVNYQMGRHPNSVVEADEPDTTVANTHQAIVSDEFALPLCFAQPTDPLPPPPLPEQLNILKTLGSSSTGLHHDDPIEVQAVARLLQQRPVWIIRDLLEAVMQTGVCPRGFFNKRIANALTYVLPVGAFNRLRIRLDYNPYIVPTSVIYQRVGIRLFRRSMEGVLLRDISRAEKIEQVIQTLRDQEVGDAPWRSAAGEVPEVPPGEMIPISAVPRCTLRESLFRVILGGNLYISCQLIDVMECERIQRLVVNALMQRENSGELEVARRTESCGWLEPQAYTAVISAYSAALVKLIEEEVSPLLRQLDEKREGTLLDDVELTDDEWSSQSSFGAAAVSSDDGFGEVDIGDDEKESSKIG